MESLPIQNQEGLEDPIHPDERPPVHQPVFPEMDRSPVIAVDLTTIEAIRDRVGTRKHYQQIASKLLPNQLALKEAVAKHASEDFKNIYTQGIKTLKPGQTDEKRAVERAFQDDKKVWQAKLTEAKRKLTSPASDPAGAAIRDLVEFQSETRAHQKAEERVQQGVEALRHRDTLAALTNIDRHSYQITEYQTQFSRPFKSKTLELQLKQLDILEELMQETQRQGAINTSQLAAIVKNTGLPLLPRPQKKVSLVSQAFNMVMDKLVFDKKEGILPKLVAEHRKPFDDAMTQAADAVKQYVEDTGIPAALKKKAEDKWSDIKDKLDKMRGAKSAAATENEAGGTKPNYPLAVYKPISTKRNQQTKTKFEQTQDEVKGKFQQAGETFREKAQGFKERFKDKFGEAKEKASTATSGFSFKSFTDKIDELKTAFVDKITGLGFVDIAKVGFETLNERLKEVRGVFEDALESFMNKASRFKKSDVFSKENIARFTPARAMAGLRRMKDKFFKWSYKKGQGDEDAHVGAKAQDMNKEFGDKVAPNGKEFDAISWSGITGARIADVDERLSKVEKKARDSAKAPEPPPKEKPTVTPPSPEEESPIFKQNQSILEALKDIRNILASGSRGENAEAMGKDEFKAETFFGRWANKLRTSKKGFVGSARNKLASGLEEGKYKDGKTGKPIKRLKDIKNSVVDDDGTIIIERSELPLIATKLRSTGRFIKAGLGIAGKVTGKIFSTANSNAATVFKTGLSAIKKTWAVGQMILDAPTDVYVEGEEEPRLTAIGMRNGEYRLRGSGKVVTRPGEIDGTVLDSEDKVVLTLKDIAKGLVNVHGKPIRSIKGKIANAIGVTLGLGYRAARSVFRLANSHMSKLGGKLGKMWNYFKEDFGLNIQIGSNKVLNEIRDILDERLPGAKRSQHRKGDWRDQHHNKNEEKPAEKKPEDKQKPEGQKRENIFDTMARKVQEKKERAQEVLSGITDALGNRKTAKTAETVGKTVQTAEKVAETTKKASLAAKTWKGVKMIGGGALTALEIGSLLGIEGVAGATSLAMGAGSLAVSAGTGLLAGAGAVLGGIATVLSSPVVLGAAAIAATAYGGYKLYQFATRNKMDSMEKLRYAQYGFDPADNSHFHKVYGLEQMLLDKHLSYREGQAVLSDKDFDVKKAMALFDVTPTDEEHASKWMTWFKERFKPVFLTNVTALFSTNPKINLHDISKLNDQEKIKYLRACSFPDGPYGVTDSPVPDLEALPAGKDMVDQLAKDAIAEYEDDSAKDKRKTKNVAAVLGQNSDSAQALAKENGLILKKDKDQSWYSKVATWISDKTGMSWLAKKVISFGTTVSIFGEAIAKKMGGMVSALEAIRFKCYGLKEMELDKVSSLRNLEEIVGKSTRFTADNTAEWYGSIEEIIDKQRLVFSIVPNTPHAEEWSKWFTKRFLPTYLTYVNAIKTATGKLSLNAGADALTANQKLDIADKLVAVSGIWDMYYSAWENYVVDVKKSDTEQNRTELEAKAKKEKLAEEKSTSAVKETAALPPAAAPTANYQQGKKVDRSFMDGGVASPASYSPGQSYSSPAQTAAPGMMKTSYEPGGGGAPAPSLPGSSSPPASSGPDPRFAFKDSGEGGFAASVNTSVVPPKGPKGYDNLKDTVISAAKKVGINPTTALAIVGQESGFDPSIKSPASSAAGLFQFIKATWDTMVRTKGPKYGITPGTPPTDPVAASLMGAEYLKENQQVISSVKPRPNAIDLYMAHFLGGGGARKFFQSAPNEIAARVFPQAAAANGSIFRKDKGHGEYKTIAEVYDTMKGFLFASLKRSHLDELISQLTGAASDPLPGAKDAPATKTASASTTTGQLPPANPGPAAASGGPLVPPIKVPDQKPTAILTSFTPGTTQPDKNIQQAAYQPQIVTKPPEVSNTLAGYTPPVKKEKEPPPAPQSFDKVSEDAASIARENLRVNTQSLTTLQEIRDFLKTYKPPERAQAPAQTPSAQPSQGEAAQKPNPPRAIPTAPIKLERLV